ncbi:MAG: Dabb family protein [Clostridia bacterium]|nr:Dabb family protein [Clostridia bacterium]
MVRHIILWKLKPELEDKESVMQNAKRALESLAGVVPGLLKVKVQIQKLPSSSADMMLYTEFEDAGALAAYQKHPAHVAAAATYVRPFTAERVCIDYEA